ncbi:MAG: mitochondrial fission ELM1 family protein [Candidatus Omnitrophica bacterium]|nr:mitochondrial fission ELM1 family protein [Candidatus Omnitrophota bacterium]
MNDFGLYYLVKFSGWLVRLLPLRLALSLGRAAGWFVYLFDVRHRALVYANLKIAFSTNRSLRELQRITKKVFYNYGQNIVELLRLPLLNQAAFERLVKVDGKEHVTQALKQGKGCILLAGHFGSWEMASAACSLMGLPYRMFVRNQERNSRLDELLNSYRTCGGSVVLTRGGGTRDMIKSLKDNKVVGMVMDQGGRDGELIPFLGRPAAMSVGAMRLALKMGVPVCFAVMIRQTGKQGRHRMIIHPALDLTQTGDEAADVRHNLLKVMPLLERYVSRYPSEYMWFYKIWKYSDQAHIAVFSDGKTGHLRQSQTVAFLTQQALLRRKIAGSVRIIRVEFRSPLAGRLFSWVSIFLHPVVCQGRLQYLKWILSPDCFKAITAVKADFIISTGSSVATVNYLLSLDHTARSMVVLKPGLLSWNNFELVILPEHDRPKGWVDRKNVIWTKAAPNLISADYLKEETEHFLPQYPQLQDMPGCKVGVFIGGDSAQVYLDLAQIRELVQQLKDVCQKRGARILVTTSRRTPQEIDRYVASELSGAGICPVLILPNQDDVPHAVGGILGIADIVIVSGDSISMISEAASSGKPAIVFAPKIRPGIFAFRNKHKKVMDALRNQGYILETDCSLICQAVEDVINHKIVLQRLHDQEIIAEGVERVV